MSFVLEHDVYIILCSLSVQGRPTIMPSDLGDILVRKGKDANGICFQMVTGNNGPPHVTKGRENRPVTKFTFDSRCLRIFAQEVRDYRYVVSVSNLHGRATATFRLVYYGKCFPPPSVTASDMLVKIPFSVF